MKDYNFQVDLKGLIALLSDHLYSRDDVFLRELLQNGVDAVSARKLMEPDFTGGCIRIEYNNNESCAEVICIDNGIGLTEMELHQFLAVIGQSSKRGEEVRKSFIGQFGIGLLSCFLVADVIEVSTCSAKDKSSHRWIGYSDGTYQVTTLFDFSDIGTKIRLKFKKNVENKFNRSAICHGLQYYGALLSIPITFRYEQNTMTINSISVPWRQEMCTKSAIMQFGELIFRQSFLDAVFLNADGIQGYAYILDRPQPISGIVSHRIYLKNMFLTENERSLIPKWASFTRCVVDVEDLTPTVSREGLQQDEKLLRARTAIEKILLDYLKDLTKYDISKMKRLAKIHNLSFKAFAAENDKILKLLFPFLIFTTSKGNLTGAQILEATKKYAVFYCIDVDSYRRTTPLLKYSKNLLVNAGYVYETDILNKLTKINPDLPLRQFEDSLLDQIFEEPEKTIKQKFISIWPILEEELNALGCRPLIKSLFPPELPALFVENINAFWGEELETDLDEFSFLDGFEEYKNSSDGELFSTLYLNSNNKLVQKLTQIKDFKVLCALARVICIQARLAGHYSVSVQELESLTASLEKILSFTIGGK